MFDQHRVAVLLAPGRRLLQAGLCPTCGRLSTDGAAPARSTAPPRAGRRARVHRRRGGETHCAGGDRSRPPRVAPQPRRDRSATALVSPFSRVASGGPRPNAPQRTRFDRPPPRATDAQMRERAGRRQFLTLITGTLGLPGARSACPKPWYFWLASSMVASARVRSASSCKRNVDMPTVLRALRPPSKIGTKTGIHTVKSRRLGERLRESNFSLVVVERDRMREQGMTSAITATGRTNRL